MCRFRLVFYCAGLAALTVLAYLPIWDNDFVDFDDPHYITTNPYVMEGISWPGLRWIWKAEKAPYWMPLTWLSFQLDAHFFSAQTPDGQTLLSAAAFHGQNLFWHGAAALLLFAVWRRMTGREEASFLVAALFAVHPMHVESVAWAAERKDVLSAAFGVLSLGAYVCYVEKPNWLRYLAVVLAFLLSLMSKPMLITFPFVLLLLDYWPLGRLRLGTIPREITGQHSLGRLIVEKAPLFLLAAAVAVLTLHTREQRGSLVPLDNLSFPARLANALTAYGWYLSTSFYPNGLAVLYLHPYEDWALLPALMGAGTLLCLTWIAWKQAARRPWLIVGWLWFVGTLLPVIGFAQGGKQAWADRFSYWPHIGLFVAVVWELAEWTERFRVPAPLSRLVGAIALAWLAALTWQQVGYWRNTLTLWNQALVVNRENDQPHEHLGQYYYGQGDAEKAKSHLEAAWRIQKQRLRRSRS